MVRISRDGAIKMYSARRLGGFNKALRANQRRTKAESRMCELIASNLEEKKGKLINYF